MSQAVRSFSNPYIAGDPVGKTPAFVGRADVLREVLRVLRHPHQNAIVLYGQRRIGKTSILQWLEAHLPEEGPYRPVYLDLMNYSGQPLDTLLQNLARGVARALGQPRPTLEGDIRETFREQFIPQVLAALPEETALVLLMDEFDVQADSNADRKIKQAFFSYMRTLRQVSPQRLQFVFALGRTIDDLDIVARGLFKDLPSKRVSLLSRKDTEHLIRLAERQGSLRWTQPAVEAIWDLTHGHPYLVQALCAEVWETVHERWEGAGIPKAYKADVEAAVEPVLERSAHMFAWIWEGLGPAEKVAAAALAEAGSGPVSEDRLEAILAESGVRILIRELRDAPRQLQAWDILEKAEGGYRFRVELLRRWIAEHHPLDRTQDELDRVNPVADNLYQAGRGLYERGDLEGARDMLERALGLNPSHQGALELLGEIALAQGDLDVAQRALEALLELAPRRARERLVQVYLRRGEETLDDEEQEQWYLRALEIAPEHSRVRERLVQVYVRRAEKAWNEQEWQKWYRQARDVAPESPQVQEALRAFEAAHRAAVLQSEHEAILQLEQKGQYHTALERAEVLQKQYPEADFLPALIERLKRKTHLAGLFQEAETALKEGNPEAAIPALQEIIVLEPTYRDGEAAALLYQAIRGEDPVILRQELETIQRRFRLLKQEYDEQSEALTNLKKQHKALAAKNASLSQELEGLQHRLGVLKQKYDKQKEVLADLKKKNETLANRNTTLKDQNATLSAERKRLQTELEDCEREKAKVEQQIRELQKKAQGVKGRTSTTPSAANVSTHLSPWNPLNYLRLLFWVFFNWARLDAYRVVYRREPMGNRLALILAFWPLLWPTLGLGLGLLPRAEYAWSASTYFWLALGIGGIWLFFLAFADRLDEWGNKAVVVAVVVALGMVFFVAFFVAVGVTFGMTFGMVLGMAVGMALFVAVFTAVGVVSFVVFFVAVSMAFGMAVGVVADIVGATAFFIAFSMVFSVAVSVDEGPSVLRALVGVLGLVAQIAMPFLSLGGWVWLQTGHWPVPVWPF